MSCEVVQPYGNPLLATKIVSELQDDFSAKDYLDKVYPIAFIGEQKLDNSIHRFPRVYLDDGANNYIDVMPDDKLKGYTFFEIIGTENYDLANDEVTLTLSQIFWFNLRKIDDKGYDYKDELIVDAVKTLKDGYMSNEISNVVVTENFESIFDRYTLPQETKQFFMYPYTGFKLTYEMTACIDVDCLPSFTITSSPSDC